MNVISRKQAKAEGRTHYFTGNPCPCGHITKRFVSTRKCGGCAYAEHAKRYNRDREREKARGRARGHIKLPLPTRPCPSVCELCGKPPKIRALHLDHDHKTNKFRGWLCSVCNTTLGKFGDDLAGVQQAALYLRRNTLLELSKEAQDRKAIPIATGVLDYFPLAICAVAQVSYIGNEQHNPGQPLHWDRSKSTDEADAMMRHFRQRGELDTDGLRHSAKVAWRALALLQKEIEAEQQEKP